MTTWQTLLENLGFVAVAVAIAAAVFLFARVMEKILAKETGKAYKWDAKRLAATGLLGALSGVLMLLEIPLLFVAPSFYKLDFSEVAVMIAGFLLGPVAAVSTELLKILLHVVLKGTSTAFVGEFASFVTGCILVLPASFVYIRMKTRKGAVLGLILGTVLLTVLGSVFNAVYLLPRFSELYGMPLEAIIGMGTKINPAITSVWSFAALATAPFNLIKGAAVSAVVLLIYKPISNLYRKIG